MRSRLDRIVNNRTASTAGKRKAMHACKALDRQLSLWSPLGNAHTFKESVLGVRFYAALMSASLIHRGSGPVRLNISQLLKSRSRLSSRLTCPSCASQMCHLRANKTYRVLYAEYRNPAWESTVFHIAPGNTQVVLPLTLLSKQLFGWLQRGLALKHYFNEALTAWAVRGQEDDDIVEVTRDPASVRPLSRKNTDNKIIRGVMNAKLAAAINQGACQLQRGFLQGRN